MYSNGTKDFTGEIKLSYKKFSQTAKYHSLTLSVDARQYLYDYNKEYTRITPQLNIEFKKPSLRSKIYKYLNTSYVHLVKEEETLGFINAQFGYANNRTINPFSAYSSIEKGYNYSKIQLGGFFRKMINQKKQLNIRGYIGYVNTEDNIYNLKNECLERIR